MYARRTLTRLILAGGALIAAACAAPLTAAADSVDGTATEAGLLGYGTDPVTGCHSQDWQAGLQGAGAVQVSTAVAGVINMGITATSAVGGCQGDTVQDFGTVTAWVSGPAIGPLPPTVLTVSPGLTCGTLAAPISGTYFRIGDALFVNLQGSCAAGSSTQGVAMNIFVDGAIAPVQDASGRAGLAAYSAQVIFEPAL